MTEAERAIGTPDGQADETAGDQAEQLSEDTADTQDTPDTQETPDTADAPDTGNRGRRRIPMLAGVALFAFVLDLVTKLLVVSQLEHRDAIEVIGTVLQFKVVRNRGAAFGIGEALTVVLTLIAVVVVLVIIRLARKLYSTPWAIALGLLLGGACGNLVDRIFRSPGVFQGAVVDFIAPRHFAVFNIADSAIVCGGILIVLLSFRGLDPDGTVHRD